MRAKSSPSTHSSADDAALQPSVNAVQVDPRAENLKLKKVAELRYKAAARMLKMHDLTPLQVSEHEPVVDDNDEPMDLSTGNGKTASATPSTSDKNTEAASSKSTEATTQPNASTSNETPPEETLPAVPDLESVPDNHEQIIGSAVIYNYDKMDTKKLRRKINSLRASMNKTSKRFYDAHRECIRLRDEYYEKCIMHAEIAKNIHIRDTLKITSAVQRPFTEVQHNLLHDHKLRSGKVIKQESENTPEMKEKQLEFKDTSFELLRNLAKNAGTTDRDSKRHGKKSICMLQVFEERCAICGKYFRTKVGLTSHLAAHTKTYYKCTFCSDRKFASDKSFRRHLTWHSLGEPTFECQHVSSDGSKCEKTFESQKQLDSH